MPSPVHARNVTLRLSREAERAVKRLESWNCDAQYLRALVRLTLPPKMSRRQVDGLCQRLATLRKDLEKFSSSEDGICLFPPLTGPTWIASFLDSYRWLESRLRAWLRRSRRRTSGPDMVLASLCGYVLARTGQPHDREVADLWAEMPTARPSRRLEPRSAEAVRRFRERNKALIEMTSTRLKSSASLPPPSLGSIRTPTDLK
jgi:hypothetical protein